MSANKAARSASTAAMVAALFALLALAAGAAAGADAFTPGGEGHDSPSGHARQLPHGLPPIRNSAHFAVAPDLRLCPSPLCGGFWVKRVNRAFTACADGTLAESCYVADLDLSRTGLSEAQQASVRAAAGHLLMQGSIRATTLPPLGTLGVFQARQAWIGHAGAPATGTFYRARDTGIVCVAYPCENVRISPLNLRSPVQLIAGVDLDAVSPDPEDGYAQLDGPQGLIASGELVAVSGAAGSSVELRASDYFLPVVPEFEICGPAGVRACGRGEFCDLGGKTQCGRAGMPGVCELRPQACNQIFDPVCGCDGKTYANACMAHGAGVGVDHAGSCP